MSLLKSELAYQRATGQVTTFNSLLLLHRLAAIYESHGQDQLAETSLQEAFKVAQKSPSKLMESTGIQLSTPMISMYKLLMKEGRFGEAEKMILRGISLEEQSNGKNSSDLQWILDDLAGCYRAEGKNKPADDCLRRKAAIEARSAKGETNKIGRCPAKLVAYLDLLGSRGFDYRFDFSDDGSSVTPYDVSKHNDFEQHRYQAVLEFSRALFCERMALDAKENGKQATYAAMHKRTTEAISNTLTELQENIDIARTKKSASGDEKKQQVEEFYLNNAYCYALINRPKDALVFADKYENLVRANAGKKAASACAVTKKRRGNPGYYFTLASIMLAEKDLTEARELVVANIMQAINTNQPDSQLVGWLMLAEVERLQGHSAEAVKAATEARKLLPTLDEEQAKSARYEIESQMEMNFSELLVMK